MNKMEQVREFQASCGRLEPRGFEDKECRALRRALIGEEYMEFVEAETHNDIVGVADALADLLYVIYGTAHEYGIPLEEIFDEVHRSNMTKFIDGYYRVDGKWMKGKSYEEPRIESILREHGLSV